MLLVQVLDGMVITPRIVGRSVGLRPIEVLLTMMAAATLFGFLGVLLAVPLGAVVKILVGRATTLYLESDFYRRPPTRPCQSMSPPRPARSCPRSEKVPLSRVTQDGTTIPPSKRLAISHAA